MLVKRFYLRIFFKIHNGESGESLISLTEEVPLPNSSMITNELSVALLTAATI